MADTIPIRLEGGPCDGRNMTAHVGDSGPVGVDCGGVNYQPTARRTRGGRLIYTTKASQEEEFVAETGGDLKHSHGPGSWHHMLRRVFVDAPKELQRSAKVRHAMRGLRHRRGLR